MIRNPRVPAYCRHKATNQALVKIDGRTIYLGIWNSPASKQKYLAALAEMDSRAMRRAGHDPLLITLATEYQIYVREAFPKPSSVPDYTNAALIAPCDLYGRLRASEFGPVCLTACRDVWISEDKARNTINKYHKVVVAMFRWGVGKELVRTETWQALTALDLLKKGRSKAREKVQRKPVDLGAFERTCQFLPVPLAAVSRIRRLNGARPEEILALKPKHFVDLTKKVWVAVLDDHKTAYKGKVKVLLFGPQAQAILKPLMDREPDSYLFTPADARKARTAAKAPRRPNQKPNTPKTARKVGPRYTSNSYRQAVHRAVERANADAKEKGLPLIEDWVPYALRNTAAQAAYESGGLEVVKELLGHSSTEMSAVYTLPDFQRAMALMEQTG